MVARRRGQQKTNNLLSIGLDFRLGPIDTSFVSNAADNASAFLIGSIQSYAETIRYELDHPEKNSQVPARFAGRIEGVARALELLGGLDCTELPEILNMTGGICDACQYGNHENAVKFARQLVRCVSAL